MALPTLNKNWNIHSNVAVSYSVDAKVANRRWIYTWKEHLKTLGATVSGSSDASTYGMDGVDRITDYTKWVQGSTNPRSWIVLRFPNIGSKFEICVDSDYLSDWAQNQSLIVSPSAGFGAVNGGTDGSLGARPTATDGILVSSASSWLCGGQYSWNDAHRGWFWGSTDGTIFYWARLLRSVTYCFGMLGLVRNTPPEWTTNPKWFMAVFGGGGRCANRSNLMDSANTVTKIGSTYLGMYCTQECFGNTSRIAGWQLWPGELATGYPIVPIGLYSTTYPWRGRAGDLTDIYWGAEGNVLLGDTYPGDGSRQFVQLDQLVLPWDGSIPIIAN